MTEGLTWRAFLDKLELKDIFTDKDSREKLASLLQIDNNKAQVDYKVLGLILDPNHGYALSNQNKNMPTRKQKLEGLLLLRRGLMRKELREFIDNPITKYNLGMYDFGDEELQNLGRENFKAELDKLKKTLEKMVEDDKNAKVTPDGPEMTPDEFMNNRE